MAKTLPTDPIALLEQRLDSHRQQRHGLETALTALTRVGETPDETISLAQQATARRAEIAGLDDAIAALEAELTQAKQQAAAQVAEQAIADDAAVLATGRDRGAALAAELAAAVAQVESVLQRIGKELPGYDEPYRRVLTRELPNEWPSEFHRVGDVARVSASAFLDGQGVWHLPELVQVRDRMELRSHTVDIRPPAPRYAISPGGRAGNSAVASAPTNIKTFTQAELVAAGPAGAHLLTMGYTGPDADAAQQRVDRVRSRQSGRRLPGGAG